MYGEENGVFLPARCEVSENVMSIIEVVTADGRGSIDKDGTGSRFDDTPVTE